MEKLKKIPYGRQTITEEDIKAVVNVLKSDFITQGPKVSAFEEAIAKYHGAKYGVAFSNGTAALHAAYAVLGIKKDDEIITSAVTFASTANAAIYSGARPILVDIDLKTNCIDIDQIEGKVTNKTKVITPVSLAGYPVNLKNIKKIANRHNCFVIHDAAHAIGSKRNGSFGMEYVDMAILSFHPVKHITTGEGGMVLTNDEELHRKLLLFKSHGITKDPSQLSHNDGGWYYEMQSLGYNYRLPDINAALGTSQFERINENLRRRNEIAKRYDEAFCYNEDLILAPSLGFEILCREDAADIHSYHLYTLRLVDGEKRLKFYNYLHDVGIMAQIHYIPLYKQPYYKQHFGYREEDFPNAEKYYKSEISIPMFHGMKNEEQEYVIEKILAF